MRKQRGVLRTNCIDCLDRTNVAQFAAGLSALGRQLVGLGLAARADLDPRSSVASHLMSMYESMGNTLARQVSHASWRQSLQLAGFLLVQCMHSCICLQGCSSVLQVPGCVFL